MYANSSQGLRKLEKGEEFETFKLLHPRIQFQVLLPVLTRTPLGIQRIILSVPHREAPCIHGDKITRTE